MRFYQDQRQKYIRNGNKNIVVRKAKTMTQKTHIINKSAKRTEVKIFLLRNTQKRRAKCMRGNKEEKEKCDGKKRERE